jgi:hypothetical protein
LSFLRKFHFFLYYYWFDFFFSDINCSSLPEWHVLPILNCNYGINTHFCINFIYTSLLKMSFCLMFINFINLFICFPSLSFSFKLCIQLCDDVCARGVQVVNYSVVCSCYNLYQKKKIKSIIIQNKNVIFAGNSSLG